MSYKDHLSPSLRVLNLGLSDRAIRATSMAHYRTISDIAYGAWLVSDRTVDMEHLQNIVQIADELAAIAHD